MFKTACIIPARSESKEIPNKNIIDLCGKPMMAYTIEAAIKAKGIDRVFVTTDSKQYADIAQKYGAECPFLRGKELASDNMHAVYPVIDYLVKLETLNIYNPDIVVMLLPTSPLRDCYNVNLALTMFKIDCCKDASVISVKKGIHPIYAHIINKEDGTLRKYKSIDNPNIQRQTLTDVYQPNGSIYISMSKELKYNRTFYSKRITPFLMDQESSIDVNNEFDLKIARLLMKERLKNEI